MLDMMQSNLFEDEILSGGEPTPEVDQAAQLRQQLEDEQRALRAEAEAARTDAWQARQERDRADNLRMQAEWKAQQDSIARGQAQQAQATQQQWLAQQQANAQALQPPPPISATDLDAIMSDPRRLEEAMNARAAYVYQAAQQQMQQRDAWHEQRLNETMNRAGQYFEKRINDLTTQVGGALQPVNAMAEQRATAEAESDLAAWGVSSEDFRSSLPDVQAIVRGANPALASNGRALALAYMNHKMNQPAQRDRPTPPMSLSSDPSPTPSRRQGGGNFDRAEMLHIAKIRESLGNNAAKAIIEARRKGEV